MPPGPKRARLIQRTGHDGCLSTPARLAVGFGRGQPAGTLNVTASPQGPLGKRPEDCGSPVSALVLGARDVAELGVSPDAARSRWTTPKPYMKHSLKSRLGNRKNCAGESVCFRPAHTFLALGWKSMLDSPLGSCGRRNDWGGSTPSVPKGCPQWPLGPTSLTSPQTWRATSRPP